MSKKLLKREYLLEAGGIALDEALTRLAGRYTPRADKIALMRVIGNLITSIGGVLRDADLDELMKRVEALEGR